MPQMGSAGARFGRNFPLENVFPDESRLLTPNPRTVSRELLTRQAFQPATTLNLLAAAWLQFMVHDWLSHGKNDKDRMVEIPLADDDPWSQRPMLVARTRTDPAPTPADASRPPAYVNTKRIGGRLADLRQQPGGPGPGARLRRRQIARHRRQPPARRRRSPVSTSPA